jgi:hypothetical protein
MLRLDLIIQNLIFLQDFDNWSKNELKFLFKLIFTIDFLFLLALPILHHKYYHIQFYPHKIDTFELEFEHARLRKNFGL